MRKLSRRELIIGTLGAVSTAAFSYNYGKSWWQDSDVIQGQSLPTRLVTAGVNGQNFKGPLSSQRCTLLSEVDLKDGWIKQTQLPMVSPHAPSYLPENRILVLAAHASVSLVVDSHHNTVHKFETPEGYVFGGHSYTLEDKGLLVISIKKRLSNSMDDAGFVDFYDLKNYRLVKRLPTLSTFAHDIARINPDTLVVSQYGTLYFDFQKTDKPYRDENGVVFLMQVVKPLLSYIDLKTMSFVHHRELKQFHGLNHIDVAPDENIYAVSVQAVEKTPEGLKFISEHYNDSEIFNQQNIDKSTTDNFLSLPSPMALIPKQGDVQNFIGKPSQQIRSQDLISDPHKNWAVSSFPNSQTIGVLRPGQDINLVSTKDWGVLQPRGLCKINDSQMIGVADQESGLVIVDVESMKKITSANLRTHRLVHIDAKNV